MNQRQYLIKGTLFLTLAGLLTRIGGFFYKIFLSRTIGAKEIGLYQLTVPVLSLCMAVACGGIQTAISRFTAEYHAQKDSSAAKKILKCSLLFSGGLSVLCAVSIHQNASWIAANYLLEPSCEILLQIIACSLPFAVTHACISGYFIGIKNISVSAVSQLIEQLLRMGTAFLFYGLFQNTNRTMDARVMALGQVAGELSSALYCIYYLCYAKKHTDFSASTATSLTGCGALKKVLSVSFPLGLNRILMCVLQSMEAALLPQKLQHFGMTSHSALASYGTLTGMALPLILFPTALTSAISTLLLPTVSEAQALHQDDKISITVKTSIITSFSMGFCFLLAFLLYGTFIGTVLFESTEAGIYIQSLAWICPFLYLNTTLISVLHGIGKTSAVFVWNLLAFGIRLAAVIWAVPHLGIQGYLLGTIGSQFFLSCCICFSLRQYLFSKV